MKAQNNILRLLKIMDDLRLNCPWDKKQTLDSLKRLTLEETFELNDAIENKNFENIKEELGDLLLHIVFYSKIASEKNHFDFNDVVEKICEKLIERHPHIYGELKIRDENDVKHNWEMIKKEKSNKSLLSGLPKTLPPMSKAYRVQEKVSSVGFDWKKSESVIDKIFEEFNEFQSAISSKNKTEIRNEFGDILFSLINYARHNNIDPEESLNSSTEKFKKRFNTLEKIVETNGVKIKDITEKKLNDLWEKSKKINS